MTSQVSEKLLHNGTKYRLCTEPLESYLKQHRPDIKFVSIKTSCWRGYEGAWQIRNGKLYLTGLAGNLRQGNEPYPKHDPDALNKVFPDAGGEGLFADWFTGELCCPYGDLLHSVPAGYASVYRHELIVQIKNGLVVSEEVKENLVPPGGFRRQVD